MGHDARESPRSLRSGCLPETGGEARSVRPRVGPETGRRALPRRAPSAGGPALGGVPSRRAPAGFTLLELIVVMTLIGILAAVALPAYRDATLRAKEAVLKEDLHRMRAALDEYHTDKGEYPQALVDLVNNGYLRAVPVDPITESDATWDVEYAPWDMIDEGEVAGIWQVRSGADGMALDGTLYRNW